MSLHGKSTIQLYNADSGVLEEEHVNHNIVTNAVSDIVNGNDPLGMLKVSRCVHKNNSYYVYSKYINYLDYMKPLATRAFGGLMLWDSNIPENAAITTMPAGVKQLGNAGGNYNGDDIYRGNYNGNESGTIANGYRHVWDFATDKGNGTIKCLSLTSRHGGNYGHTSSISTKLRSVFAYCYVSDEQEYEENAQCICTNTNSCVYSSVAAGMAFYMAKNADGTIWQLLRDSNLTQIRKVTLSNPNVCGISTQLQATDTVDFFTVNELAEVYVADGKIHEVYVATKTTLQHNIYSLQGEQLATHTITLPKNAYSSTYRNDSVPFFYRGKYYYYTGYGTLSDGSRGDIYQITDANGNDLGTTGAEGSSYLSSNYYLAPCTRRVLGEYHDRLLFSGRTQNSSYVTLVLEFSDSDGFRPNYESSTVVDGSSYGRDLFPIITPYDTPFVYFGRGTQGGLITTSVDWRYLATINNLATPVTKTSAQTMKITYDLVEV